MTYEYQIKMNIPQMTTYGHAYLDELDETNELYPYSVINPEDERHEHWAEQRRVYGFDDSETWNLNSTFYAWLYEHLRMYVDVGGEVVNLEFHKFKWHGCEYTQLELINEILDRIRFYFSEDYDDFEEEQVVYTREIGEIWATILPAMWW